MLERIHDRLREELALTQARLDLILVAPDAPERAGPRRKPGPGMIEEALARFRVLPAEAPVIGDALSDLQAAAAAGCPRLLVRTGKGAATQAAGIPGAVLPVAVYDDLAAAVTALLGGRG
jgi:D-glycero-D-manno-heptose 1,7-bisphosphate phosphatase